MDFCCVQIPEERNDLIINGFKAAGITEAAEKANKVCHRIKNPFIVYRREQDYLPGHYWYELVYSLKKLLSNYDTVKSKSNSPFSLEKPVDFHWFKMSCLTCLVFSCVYWFFLKRWNYIKIFVLHEKAISGSLETLTFWNRPWIYIYIQYSSRFTDVHVPPMEHLPNDLLNTVPISMRITTSCSMETSHFRFNGKSMETETTTSKFPKCRESHCSLK